MRKITKLIGVALIATGMMASFTGCTGLYNQIDELEKELAEEKAKNDKLTEDKDKAEEELAKELKKNADLVAQIKELEETIKASTKKAEALTTEIIALKKAAENNELTAEQKAAYEKELNDLKAEKTRLEKVITDTQTELNTARAKLDELENKISKLEDELETVTWKVVFNLSATKVDLKDNYGILDKEKCTLTCRDKPEKSWFRFADSVNVDKVQITVEEEIHKIIICEVLED